MTTAQKKQLTLQDCLRHAGYPEEDWLTLSASQRAIAVVMANKGGAPRASLSTKKRESWKAHNTIVYFLGAGPFVKIGKATGDPSQRIDQLKTGCPFPIQVLGFVPGGRIEESLLHSRFAKYRAHGEWFRNEGALAEYLKTLVVQ